MITLNLTQPTEADLLNRLRDKFEAVSRGDYSWMPQFQHGAPRQFIPNETGPDDLDY